MKLHDLYSILGGNEVVFDETKFDHVINTPPMLISTFYRSDCRTLDKLEPNGFSPKVPANSDDIYRFVKACCTLTQNEAMQLSFANEFRSSSEYAKYGDYFVSTAVDCGQKCGIEYKIEGLEMAFHKVTNTAVGGLYIGISQSDWKKPIRAVKLSKNEVVFLDSIPMSYIRQI